MSATDEELRTVNGAGMDHVTYILIMFRLVAPLSMSLTHRLIVVIVFRSSSTPSLSPSLVSTP